MANSGFLEIVLTRLAIERLRCAWAHTPYPLAPRGPSRHPTLPRPSLNMSCRYCDSSRVIPVKDKGMDGTVRRWGGNRFRVFCRTCRRFGNFTSRENWETHPDARILPADADDEEPELLAADGSELENRFVCPQDGCDAVHDGYPEQCDVCGVPYNWS